MRQVACWWDRGAFSKLEVMVHPNIDLDMGIRNLWSRPY
jgi:hypothetical protein